MVFNTLDYIFLMIIAIGGIIGLMRGLISSIMGIVGYIAAFWAAKTMSPIMASFLTKTAFANSVRTVIMERFNQAGFAGVEQFDLSAVTQNPELGAYLSDNPLIHDLIEKQSALVSTGQNIVDLLLRYFFQCIAALIIFVIIKVIITLFSTALSSLARTSTTLSTTNRIGGLVFGSLGGMMLSAVIVTILLPVLMTYNPSIDALVQHSVISQGLFKMIGGIMS